jgi:hypothetical protein
MALYAITWTVGETRVVNARSIAHAEEIITNMTDDELLRDLKNIMASFEVMDIEKL